MARKLGVVKKGVFYIKGAAYTMEMLLHSPAITEAMVYVFRLAPEHYHRIHSPTQSKITSIRSIQGNYKSVNPILLNRNPVLQENYRKVITFANGIVMVAVGATCVGSIALTVHSGDAVRHGEDLGCFKFGGSCIVVIIPTDLHPTAIRRLTVEEKYMNMGQVVASLK
jgi:phosphatidylserine decarboxylase